MVLLHTGGFLLKRWVVLWISCIYRG